MHIVHLTGLAIEAGRTAFREYSRALLCGPETSEYDPGLSRDTGLSIIPGAVLACIEHGIVEEQALVHAVARVTRCRRSTVLSVVETLAGRDPQLHLWRREFGIYSSIAVETETGLQPAMLLAA